MSCADNHWPIGAGAGLEQAPARNSEALIGRRAGHVSAGGYWALAAGEI